MEEEMKNQGALRLEEQKNKGRYILCFKPSLSEMCYSHSFN